MHMYMYVCVFLTGEHPVEKNEKSRKAFYTTPIKSTGFAQETLLEVMFIDND